MNRRGKICVTRINGSRRAIIAALTAIFAVGVPLLLLPSLLQLLLEALPLCCRCVGILYGGLQFFDGDLLILFACLRGHILTFDGIKIETAGGVEIIGSGKLELRWKLQQDVLWLQVGVDDFALAVQKVQRHGDVADQIFHHRDRYASVVVRLDHTQQIAPQHLECHAHMPSVRAVVKEGVRKRRNALRMRYVRYHRNLICILGGKVDIQLRLASSAFRHDAVQ
mmetsp:Transcript_3972/g.9336  ORF Transcript_3972/g.9336 Transcript_3972/m.9336 type:complete len:224 (-) Transcript_3972:516-1187(-)